MPNKDIVPALFEGHKIRRVVDKGVVYYSAIDVVGAIIPESKDPGNLWAKTKPSLKADGIQLVNIIHRFKLLAVDGKMRLTDCLSAENVILMIEYLHSPKAAPFRIWFAQLTAERIEEIQNPAKGIENSMKRWEEMGKDAKWIEARVKGMTIRKGETAVLQSHGISKPQDFAHFTDRTNVAVYGHTAKVEKAIRKIGKSQNLRDCSTETELGLLFLHESACKDGIEKTDAYGRPQIDGVYDVVDSIISQTKQALESAFAND